MRDQVPFRSFTHALRAAIGIAAIAALLAIVGCGGGSGGESDAHARLSELCQQTTDRESGYCDCVADAVIQRGYDTEEEINQLEPLISAINESGNVAAIPPAVVESLNACETSAAS